VDLPSSSLGIIACDEECYHTFRPLFHPILLEWNQLHISEDSEQILSKSTLFQQSYTVSSLPAKLTDFIEQHKNDVSDVRVVVVRNIGGFAMSSAIDRRDAESFLIDARGV